MKKFSSVVLSLLIINAGQSLGLPTRTVYSQDAQGTQSIGIDLKVWKGYGVTINFIPTGEIIKQVWIGDPTRISLTSNGNLCQKSTSNSNDSNENCNSVNATVLFLRQIKPISFPSLTSSSDGSTQITVITSGSDGQKQYQFKLIPATGQPSYTSLVIKPDSERPLPSFRTKPQIVPTIKETPTPLPQQTVAAVNSQAVLIGKTSTLVPGTLSLRNDANAVVYGLAIANRQGQVKVGSTTWNKAQDAIKLLRLGKSREEAVSRSGIDVKVFNQLIQWGQS